jgi:hypothetical protein
MYYWFRIALIIPTFIGLLGIVAILGAMCLGIELPRFLGPSISVASVILALFYNWVAEAYLLRRYIADRRRDP